MPAAIPANIRLLILDVDGVLTDGSIYVDDGGREFKRFCVRDGLGIKAWQHAGNHAAILSARNVACVNHRAAQLGITLVSQGSRDKGQGVRDICDSCGVPPQDACFIGDDWIDAPALTAVGFPVVVPAADHSLRAVARYVTVASGGNGAIREVVEMLMQAQGTLNAARRHFSLPR